MCVGDFCGRQWDVSGFRRGDWGRSARKEVGGGCGGCFGEVDEDGCVAQLGEIEGFGGCWAGRVDEVDEGTGRGAAVAYGWAAGETGDGGSAGAGHRRTPLG